MHISCFDNNGHDYLQLIESYQAIDLNGKKNDQ
jgi:hypothetical protein